MMEKTIGLAGITAVVLLALASAGTAQDSPSTAQQEERMGEAVRASCSSTRRSSRRPCRPCGSGRPRRGQRKLRRP